MQGSDSGSDVYGLSLGFFLHLDRLRGVLMSVQRVSRLVWG